MVGYCHQGDEAVIYVAYFKIICAMGVERCDNGNSLCHISFRIHPGFPRALENLENMENGLKNPCMEKWNLKKDEISWKNHGILLLNACLDVFGIHFQGCHGQGKSLENEIFSRSGKSQGI